MGYGKISTKQREILDYIKSEILKTAGDTRVYQIMYFKEGIPAGGPGNL